VTGGEPLLTLLTDEPERFDRALAALDGGYDIEADGSAYDPGSIVIDRIGS
jgi:thymidine phosphorylase